MLTLMTASVWALLVGISAARADDPIRPDLRLTPGAVITTDLALICRRGYTKLVRHTAGRVKGEIYREYGIKRSGKRYEIDHLIPLCLGGADVKENLWPQSRIADPWNAGKKDVLEEWMCKAACARAIPVEQLQREIAQDWISAYRKYIGPQ